MRKNSDKHGSQCMVGLVLTLALALTACGPFGKDTITTPSDTSAHNLDMSFMLSATQYPDKLSVRAIVSYQGVSVRFTRGEHITCNGVVLHFTTNTFDAYIPNVPQNRTVSCAYSDAKGLITTVAFVMVAQPIILSPKAGATIARSKTFTLTYAPQAAKQMQFSAGTYIGPDSLEGSGGCITQQITGAIVCDITKQRPDQGNITVDAQSDDVLANSGFHSANTSSDDYTRINVTWT